VTIEWLRAAGHPQDPVWVRCFEAMVEFAAGHGWVDSGGAHVRAHVDVVADPR